MCSALHACSAHPSHLLPSPSTHARQVTRRLQAADRAPLGQEDPGEEGAVGTAGRKTLETVTAADDIIEALDLATDEEERGREYEQVGGGLGSQAGICRLRVGEGIGAAHAGCWAGAGMGEWAW